ILDRLALTAGGGTITLQGRIGQTIEATLDARGLPLSLADLAQPGLGLSGTLAATARITGTPTAPNGRYDVTVTRLTSADIARAGAGPFD
ncbi:translocation/assembly module TamB, partial [Klebsiella pneumoniae]|nr:translocation/assembly module TamB [Klebsiella pneumoniae]